jgi:hypothetical protein
MQFSNPAVPPANATVTVNDVVVRMAPAEAIMSTLRMALEDPAQTPVAFRWTEGAALVVNVMQQTGNYMIAVTSLKEADISTGHDNDEDDL